MESPGGFYDIINKTVYIRAAKQLAPAAVAALAIGAYFIYRLI